MTQPALQAAPGLAYVEQVQGGEFPVLVVDTAQPVTAMPIHSPSEGTFGVMFQAGGRNVLALVSHDPVPLSDIVAEIAKVIANMTRMPPAEAPGIPGMEQPG